MKEKPACRRRPSPSANNLEKERPRRPSRPSKAPEAHARCCQTNTNSAPAKSAPDPYGGRANRDTREPAISHRARSDRQFGGAANRRLKRIRPRAREGISNAAPSAPLQVLANKEKNASNFASF